MLELTRPLLWFDLETTGIRVQIDRICQIGVIKMLPDGSCTSWETLVNPTVPIPPEATEKHKITDDMVRDAPTFAQLAQPFANKIVGCDYAGYNLHRFDIPLLAAEFDRAGVECNFLTEAKCVDWFRIYQKLRPMNLTQFLKDMADEDLGDDAHNALADIHGTFRGAMGALRKFPSKLPRTVASLHDMIFGDTTGALAGGKFYLLNGDVIVNFGKYKDKPLRSVPRDYCRWVVANTDIPLEAKRIFREAAQGIYPEKK